MDGAVTAAFVIGGVFLLAMVATAGYAARTLPAGARVPLNAGMPEHSVWLSKPAALAAWVGTGVVAYAVLALLTSGLSANWAHSMQVALLPCVMLVVLAAEAGAVITARRQCADGGGLGVETVAASVPGWDSQPADGDGVPASLPCKSAD